jgi:hypothetical protein
MDLNWRLTPSTEEERTWIVTVFQALCPASCLVCTVLEPWPPQMLRSTVLLLSSSCVRPHKLVPVLAVSSSPVTLSFRSAQPSCWKTFLQLEASSLVLPGYAGLPSLPVPWPSGVTLVHLPHTCAPVCLTSEM